jgi:uncharacterized phage protein gp47/JayE
MYDQSLDDIRALVFEVFDRELDGKADLSLGSLNYAKCSAVATAIWYAKKRLDYYARQIFPDTADHINLLRHVARRGLFQLPGETDAELLSRYQQLLRHPGSGGDQYDYVNWARACSVSEGDIFNPSTSLITHSLLGNFNATALFDSLLNAKAWDTAACVPGAYMSIDFGAENGQNYTSVQMYLSGNGGDAGYDIFYSDDGSTWINAQGVGSNSFVPSLAGWNKVSWASVGRHRYWRIVLSNTPQSSAYVTELKFGVGTEICTRAFSYPLADGDGTVSLLIISSLFQGVPSAALLSKVISNVSNSMPADLPIENVTIIGPTIVTQDVTATGIGIYDTVSAYNEISAYIDSLRPGQTLYRSQIESIIIGAGAESANVNLPVADLTAGRYEMIKSGVITLL